MSDSLEQRAASLAREFMLGFRTNLTCPDVSPSEYERVMDHRISAALRAERAAALEEAAKLVDSFEEGLDDDEVGEIAEDIAAAIRDLKEQPHVQA